MIFLYNARVSYIPALNSRGFTMLVDSPFFIIPEQRDALATVRKSGVHRRARNNEQDWTDISSTSASCLYLSVLVTEKTLLLGRMIRLQGRFFPGAMTISADFVVYDILMQCIGRNQGHFLSR